MDPAPNPPELLRFGVFEVDLHTGELRRSGHKLRMQELPFRALRLFLTRPGEVVSREDLRQELWPANVFVDFDRGISSTINRLRSVLGDTAAKPLFIETVERKGYRWVAPLRSVTGTGQTVATSAPATQKVVAIRDAETGSDELDRGATGYPASYKTQSKRAALHRRPIWIGFTAALTLLLVLGFLGVFGGPARLGRPAVAASATASAKPSANPEAEDFYLKGRYYWSKRTPDDLTKAVDFFTQAIVHDPNYGPAYVGLADCYNLLREYSAMPPSEAYPRALAAARKAVELDDASAPAHTALAFASYYWLWDATTAEREFQKALQLDPNYVPARHWYATFLMVRGRFPEALREIEQARQLDPMSSPILADKALILSHSGATDEALPLLRQIESSEPQSLSTHRYLAEVYFEQKNYPAYLEESRAFAELSHDDAALAAYQAAAQGFAAGGYTGMVDAALTEQKKQYGLGRVSAYSMATACATAGRKREAVQFLRVSYERREPAVLSTPVDPLLVSLRGDAEFEKVLTALAQPNTPPTGHR